MAGNACGARFRSFATSRCFPVLVVVCVAAILLWPVTLAATEGERDSDPVVVAGSELDRLLGLDPHRIVGFKYASGWLQIPVQVDERAVKDFGIVYNSAPRGFVTLVYADAGTFMGPDPNPVFDGDDELVFMAKDAGSEIPGPTADPAGVILGSRVEVIVTAPALGARNEFNAKRTVYFDPPGQTTALAAQRCMQAMNPLQVTVSPPTSVVRRAPSAAFYLAQNVPNPFRNETQIRFRVRRGERFSARVYDVTGRHIRTLAEGTGALESAAVVWDGTGKLAGKAASGIYFCRLESGPFAVTRKIVLLE